MTALQLEARDFLFSSSLPLPPCLTTTTLPSRQSARPAPPCPAQMFFIPVPTYLLTLSTARLKSESNTLSTLFFSTHDGKIKNTPEPTYLYLLLHNTPPAHPYPSRNIPLPDLQYIYTHLLSGS